MEKKFVYPKLSAFIIMSLLSYRNAKNRPVKPNLLQKLILFVAIFVISNQSLAYVFTCEELNGAYLESQEYNPQYLGFFGNSNAAESVNNYYGRYGSSSGYYSVRNDYGKYGSEDYGQYSANNRFTTTPPFIVKYGEAIGTLTTNPYISRGVSLDQLDDDCYFTATAPAKSYQLSVSKSGTGSGIVTSQPAGIRCGSDCRESYNAGTRVALYANPSPGSKFEGWSGACSGASACQVAINGDRRVYAEFRRLVVMAPILILLDDTK